jgi:hypothetical protein
MEFFKRKENDHLIFFTIDNVPKCIRLVENDGKVEILYVVSLNYLQMKL